MLLRLRCWKATQDHPRIRGTNMYRIAKESGELGSSPHTRDKFGGNKDDYVDKGIIPAYAGQIIKLLGVEIANEDHPRIRGTNEGIPLLWRND